MSRPAAASPDQIRATVHAMLAEGGDAVPMTSERFRQLVSVRKLRARLGAGNATTLARALNMIEAEVVRAGHADIAMPGIPPDIAKQMQALWHAAVTVQLDDLVRLKAAAQVAIAAADVARADAELRFELQRQELFELRSALSSRDAEMAELRAHHALLQERVVALHATVQNQKKQLDAGAVQRADSNVRTGTDPEATQG